MGETFADRLRVVLTARGWSEGDWSKKAGLAVSHVANLIARNSKRPSTETIEALANAAGVPFEWLARGVGDSGLGVASAGSRPQASAPQSEHPTDPAPPAIRVEPASESPLERALGAAFDHTRHTISDLRAVQDSLTDGLFPWQTIELDLVEAARTWLDAAAQMRREGQAVSTVGILFRVTLGNTPLAQELAAKRRAAMEAARTAPPRPPPMQAEESGPSGVRVIGESSSTAEPKTAKG